MNIEAVTTPQQQQQFLDVPWRVYKDDPNWVPPLRSSIAKQLAPDNPFFEYGELQQFIATENGEAVGRIVAAINRRLNESEGKIVGIFGYFECIDDFEVARSLLKAAEDWLRDRGAVVLRGPIDLYTHNNCLFLVEGFDSPPYMMMPYNPPYYPEFLERDGWYKAKDAYAYDFSMNPLENKYEKAHRIACKSGITFRPVRIKGEGFDRDCLDIYRIFTETFSHSWSASPRTEAEFIAEAKDLKQVVDPDIFPIAEYDGEMVGFCMTLPDYNIAFKHIDGKLDLWGILKLLWYRRQIDRARTIAICCLPEYRRKMVSAALVYELMEGGKKRGYKRAELSWVWQDNLLSRRITEAAGGVAYKTYRMYEKV